MKFLQTIALACILLLALSVGCTKEESTPPGATQLPSDTTAVGDSLITDTLITDTILPILSLMDSLAGAFSGLEYRKELNIYCAGGQLPCNTTWTYDTLLLHVEVVNVDDTGLYIVEEVPFYFWIPPTLVQLDDELKYEANHSTVGAPEGWYRVRFTEAPHDSLYVNNMAGGGSVAEGGGSYIYRQFVLKRD